MDVCYIPRKMKLLVCVCVFIILVIDMLILACPKIITRREWGARNVTTGNPDIRPVPYVFIHHSASHPCSTQERCSALCRTFQNFHIDNRHWNDIGYNFLIGGDGMIYEGRGWNKIGAHALHWNKNSVGICFIGTFTRAAPTDAALRAAKEFIQCGVSAGEISESYKLAGHRQVRSTECPGQDLYELIKTWPHWTESFI